MAENGVHGWQYEDGADFAQEPSEKFSAGAFSRAAALYQSVTREELAEAVNR